MKVEYVQTDILREFERNPKKHPESQLKKLEKSISEFGWTNPILATKDGMVVAGHARLEAAKRLNIGQVPVIYLDMPYEKAIAYVIADNRLAELTETDTEQLSELLGELSALPDFDIELTGFDLDEVAALNPAEVVKDNFNTGAALDVIDEPVTKRGDLILLGKHRLLCGDSTDAGDVERLMDGKNADMVFIDPPYEIDDDISFLLKNKLSILLHNDKQCIKYIYENMDIFKHIIFGRRPFSSTGVLNHPLQHHTLIAIFGTIKIFNHITPYLSSIQDDFLKNGYEKSAMFINNMVKTYSNKNDIILDPFAGSGAMIIYGEQLDRIVYSCEIDPVKCDVIVKRFEENYKIKAEYTHHNL